jgi:hypothetical protein
MNTSIGGSEMANGLAKGRDPFRLGPIRQVAYIVTDIEAAMAAWINQMGTAPFLVQREISPFHDLRFHGKPAQAPVITVAFAQIGDIQIELVQQHNDVPSIYTEFLERGCGGLHHYAFWCEDFDTSFRSVVAAGMVPVVETGDPAVARMAYVASNAIPGLALELIEWNEATRPYFEGPASRIAQWDGKTAVLEMGE